MPPKAKITKEMIIKAGLEIVRREGADSLNVRRVAAELKCSTQPVMYHYRSVGELKSDVYAAADDMHTDFIMTPDEEAGNPLLAIGMRYILFANEEKHLFRFLFQSGKFRNTGFRELVETGGPDPVIQPLCEGAGLTVEQAREAFAALFTCVHGAASLIADNDIEYDGDYYTRLLTNVFFGVIGVLKGEGSDEKTV
jgi:AcrR family transcriptional regulator